MRSPSFGQHAARIPASFRRVDEAAWQESEGHWDFVSVRHKSADLSEAHARRQLVGAKSLRRKAVRVPGVDGAEARATNEFSIRFLLVQTFHFGVKITRC